jgi:hypothetical protein
MNANAATVIMVSGRFFHKHNKKSGRIQTAWCLAGAKLFGEWEGSSEILEVMSLLHTKGYKPKLVKIVVPEEAGS